MHFQELDVRHAFHEIQYDDLHSQFMVPQHGILQAKLLIRYKERELKHDVRHSLEELEHDVRLSLEES